MKENLFFKTKGLIFLQFTLLIIVAIISTLVSGWPGLKSALLGGIAWIIPNMFFTWKLGKIKNIFDTKKMLKSFFLNEIVKMLLSFVMIIFIAALFTINKFAFLSGFASSVFGSVIASFLQGTKNASN